MHRTEKAKRWKNEYENFPPVIYDFFMKISAVKFSLLLKTRNLGKWVIESMNLKYFFHENVWQTLKKLDFLLVCVQIFAVFNIKSMNLLSKCVFENGYFS